MRGHTRPHPDVASCPVNSDPIPRRRPQADRRDKLRAARGPFWNGLHRLALRLVGRAHLRAKLVLGQGIDEIGQHVARRLVQPFAQGATRLLLRIARHPGFDRLHHDFHLFVAIGCLRPLGKGGNGRGTQHGKGQNTAHESVEQAQQAVTSLNTISDNVATISDMATQIATAAEEQSAVADEINRNVTNISDGAGQTLTAAQQSAYDATQLAEMVHNMENMLKQFGD